MNTRVDEATNRQMQGYNCSQAVACTYSDLFNLDEQIVKNITQGFGMGLGGSLEGNCGAISGGTVILGLYYAQREQDALVAKKKTMLATKMLVEKFQTRNQEITCKKLKGIDTGKMLRSCKDCVRDVAEFVEDILGEEAK